MNLLSHICVSLVYVGVLFCYFQSTKQNALFFSISASVALVLSGLSEEIISYFLCIALSVMDISMIACILLRKSNIQIGTLSIMHLPLIGVWLLYYLR